MPVRASRQGARDRAAPNRAGRPIVRLAFGYRVQVLERAMSLLDAFVPERPERGVSELARTLGLHRATVHRILSVLERLGCVEQLPESGRYRLGMKLIELGSRASAGLTLPTVAKPELEHLVRMTGETSHLMVVDGAEGLYLEKVESTRPFRMPSQVGRRLPLHCTGVGKALLAFLPEQEASRILRERGLPRFTENTITSTAALQRELARIRHRGYAVDREEAERGLRCVGAPIVGRDGTAVAAISIAGPAVRVGPKSEARFARLVLAAAQRISRRLGDVAPVRRVG